MAQILDETDDPLLDETDDPILDEAATAILSGTVMSGIIETDIVTGSQTIVLTLDGDRWIPN